MSSLGPFPEGKIIVSRTGKVDLREGNLLGLANSFRLIRGASRAREVDKAEAKLRQVTRLSDCLMFSTALALAFVRRRSTVGWPSRNFGADTA